jgi:hypothetical protein
MPQHANVLSSCLKAVGTALYGQRVRARQLQINGASAFHKDAAYTCKICQTLFCLNYLSAVHGLNYLIKYRRTETAVYLRCCLILFDFRDKDTRTTLSMLYTEQLHLFTTHSPVVCPSPYNITIPISYY